MQKKIQTVKTLLDSLPFIKSFSGSVVVIKYGGSAQLNPKLKESFAIDIVLMYMLGIRPVIVHGGGNRITELSQQLNIKAEFIDGHRVTDRDTMRVVEMVLAGEVNKEIVSFLNHHGAKSIGVCGKDANFMQARAKDGGKFGYTGDVTKVDPAILKNIIEDGYIPVIAPIASSEDAGHPGFNINADTAASEIAIALKAKKTLFLTDTPGVLDSDGELISSLNQKDAEMLKVRGVISGGMIPKVNACLRTIEGGVQKAHIIDGRIEHSLLLELFTSEGVGTQFIKEGSCE